MRSIHCGGARPPERGLPVLALMTTSFTLHALGHFAGIYAAGRHAGVHPHLVRHGKPVDDLQQNIEH